MHFKIYEYIWLKLDMVIELYIFFYSLTDLYLDSRSREWKKATIYAPNNYVTKFSISLGGIWYIVETYWCDELHTQKNKKLSCWFVPRHLQTDFFQTWYDDRDW